MDAPDTTRVRTFIAGDTPTPTFTGELKWPGDDPDRVNLVERLALFGRACDYINPDNDRVGHVELVALFG